MGTEKLLSIANMQRATTVDDGARGYEVLHLRNRYIPWHGVNGHRSKVVVVLFPELLGFSVLEFHGFNFLAVNPKPSL